MAVVLEDSACRIPLIFVLSPGVVSTCTGGGSGRRVVVVRVWFLLEKLMAISEIGGVVWVCHWRGKTLFSRLLLSSALL